MKGWLIKRMKRIIAAILIISSLVLSLSSCGKKYNLDKYEEDTDTTEKDVYYVAMAIEKYGIIILELDAINAPITVKNFVKLVREGFYDGLTFHRIMNNFMIQGGDPNGDGTGGSSETIYGEFLQNGWYNSISHKRGVISMARNNYSMDSASSQFFICNSNSASVKNLDGSYAAFGYVLEGMDVVDKITSKTAKHGDSNGMIENAKKRAVITEMKVIKYNKG